MWSVRTRTTKDGVSSITMEKRRTSNAEMGSTLHSVPLLRDVQPDQRCKGLRTGSKNLHRLPAKHPTLALRRLRQDAPRKDVQQEHAAEGETVGWQVGLSGVRSSRVQPARCHRVPLRRVRRERPSQVRGSYVGQLQETRSTSTARVHGVLPQVRQHRKKLKDKEALRCTCKGQQHSHSNEKCKLHATKAGEKRWPGCNLKDDKAVTEEDFKFAERMRERKRRKGNQRGQETKAGNCKA